MLLPCSCGFSVADTMLLQPVLSCSPSSETPIIALMSALTHHSPSIFALVIHFFFCHLQSLSSRIFLVSFSSHVHTTQSPFHAPLCDVLYIQSLPDVIIPHISLVVCLYIPIGSSSPLSLKLYQIQMKIRFEHINLDVSTVMMQTE